jgi:hypothetical protein
MMPPGHVALGRLARTMLARRAGPAADAGAIAAAAERAYTDLVRVLAAVIGDLGVQALTDRTLHLAKREFAWLIPPPEPGDAQEYFAHVVASLKRQEPAVATDAAAAVFATFLELLATFIGESLAARLVRQAWPDAFEETEHA